MGTSKSSCAITYTSGRSRVTDRLLDSARTTALASTLDLGTLVDTWMNGILGFAGEEKRGEERKGLVEAWVLFLECVKESHSWRT
jgi:hypothetical protein